jgi:hypothetical protein
MLEQARPQDLMPFSVLVAVLDQTLATVWAVLVVLVAAVAEVVGKAERQLAGKEMSVARVERLMLVAVAVVLTRLALMPQVQLGVTVETV